MSQLLVVDDKRSILDTLSMLLKQKGYDTHVASDLEQAKGVLDANPIDVVITDLRLGKASGEDLIAYMRERESPAGCIVMTGFGSIESAVNCMRLGAYDYLTKPVGPAELLIRVEQVLAKKRLNDEVHRLREQVHIQGRLGNIVAKSPGMQRVLERIRRVSSQDLPVLITGETGTGKEVLAQAVHRSSHRSEQPFVAINCCTLPEDLLDSELFGHVKGAFTGATRDSQGVFQQAHGGTLFLDEIGDISPRLQSKLLRVLQENEVRPVGGDGVEQVDVRIIAATNRNLPEMIAEGSFRADLFYRLSVVPVAIPPLRERREDIHPLIEYFMARLSERRDAPLPRLSKEALKKLLAYDYPGNVRQLENTVERTFALADGPVVTADDVQLDDELLSAFPMYDEADEAPVELEEIVVQHIRKVLRRFDGNQVLAAKAMGISRSTLRRRLGLS